MRELFDDFNDIELDDNEIIERLMREMEEEERRLKEGGAARPASKRRYGFAAQFVDNDEADEELDDEFDDDDDDYDDEDYDDYDDDRY